MSDYKQRLADAQGYYAQGLKRVATTPEPDGQKFPCGMLVKVADDLGPSMTHFESGVYAQVQHVYDHAFPTGSHNVEDYSLLIRKEPGRWYGVAWYHEWQLEEVTNPETLSMLQEELNKEAQ